MKEGSDIGEVRRPALLHLNQRMQAQHPGWEPERALAEAKAGWCAQQPGEAQAARS